MRTFMLIAIAAALIAPQAAQAATIAPLKACYRSVDRDTRENVRVQAEGFTPGSGIDVAIDDAVLRDAVTALPDGTVVGDVTAPYRARGERPFTISLTERDRPTTTVTATSRVTALALRLKPREAKPSRKVRFIGRGFTDDVRVYGHYVRAGKLRKTVDFGAPQGACGTIDVKRRQIPIRRPKTGRWTLQVDNQPEYASQPISVFVRVAITVRRVLRGGG